MNALTRTSSIVLALLAFGCGEPRVIVNDPTWVPPTDVHVVDNHIILDRTINFELDSDKILESSSGLLDNIASVINHHTHIQTLDVVGHTDAQGGPAHNQDLSERRAASVVTALEARGVRITLRPSGMGERVHLCEEQTEECQARNRRVEFVINE